MRVMIAKELLNRLLSTFKSKDFNYGAWTYLFTTNVMIITVLKTTHPKFGINTVWNCKVLYNVYINMYGNTNTDDYYHYN